MFDELIQQIWESTHGLENVLLSGIDGIVIAKHHESEEDEFLAAESASLIKEAHRLGEELHTGRLINLMTHYEDRVIIIQTVTSEYYLIGILSDPKRIGQARYRFTLKANEWYSSIA
jgi:predicted regulator of Ras-like GTPase activity (Roadblock/LC7/MglB family)